jgi:hypothetical protein
MMKKLQHIIIFVLFASALNGQVAQTILQKNKLIVGEQTTLIYRVPLKSNNQKTNFTPNEKYIPSSQKMANKQNEASETIEILGKFKDTIMDINGRFEWIGSYTIIAWDSGFFAIPPVQIELTDSLIEFPAALLQVNLMKAEKGKDIYDIQEAFEEIPDDSFSFSRFLKNYWWLLAGILCTLIGLFIYRKHKKRQGKNPIPVLSLKEKTLLAIDDLEQKRLWSSGQLKLHYSELSYILRQYLSTQYQLSLLEKTSIETKLLLSQKGVSKNTVDEIATILDQSDLVKFAKSIPEEIIVLQISALARKIVIETSTGKENDAE